VERPQAQRHEERHLQLEVRVVHETVREEREDESGEQRRSGVTRQRSHEQEHGRTG
jgi:hypothetical protein